MTTEQVIPSTTRASAKSKRGSWVGALWVVIALAILALLMGIVTTAIVWQDPIMNWSPFAVYNPQLWHWPEDWPLVSLSPTVEPFIVIGYALFYFGPFFPAVWVLRRLQARRPVESFVWRHPLIT